MERFLIRKFATASSSQDATTTKKQKTNEKCVKWHALHASLLLRVDHSCPNKNASKIACFDLDETLQKTKSGKKPFMTHENDFTFRDQSVRTALNLLHENGYKIVIFSNQGMVKSAVDGKKAEQIRKRVEIFAGELGEAKFDFYAATQSGEKDVKGYRKPNVGMWREMLSRREKIQEEELEGNEITSTFYVGDAANRPQDHSDADIAFARNCNVEFFLPEQFFEGGAFRKFLQRLETDKDDDDDSPPKEETEEEKQKGVPRGD
ncbi:unnamed protein product [Bathycoccus prasinos]|mmetsp:Transcript_931/g.2909  ORF Transcript_931/g.2909 Transcript_931/m.2909 type:complete len:263 (-) Transcript_931:92-880(-)